MFKGLCMSGMFSVLLTVVLLALLLPLNLCAEIQVLKAERVHEHKNSKVHELDTSLLPEDVKEAAHIAWREKRGFWDKREPSLSLVEPSSDELTNADGKRTFFDKKGFWDKRGYWDKRGFWNKRVSRYFPAFWGPHFPGIVFPPEPTD